jgi:hypothetical protein
VAEETDTPDTTETEKEQERPCRVRTYPNASSFVCVCSADYCDRPEPIGLENGQQQLQQVMVYYLSDRREHRLRRLTTPLSAIPADEKGEVARGHRKSGRKIFGYFF